MTVITLSGVNEFALREALSEMTNGFIDRYGKHGLERFDGESLELGELANILTSISMFAPERMVVLRDASKNKPLWEALGQWVDKVPDEVNLVIVESIIDKRTKTYKVLSKGNFRMFNELDEARLIAWAEEKFKSFGLDIDKTVIKHLVVKSGGDQWRLWGEIQKLSNYKDITKELIDLLVEPSLQDSVFDLLDAVLGKKFKKVDELLKSLRYSEDPYRLFGLMVAQTYALAVSKNIEGDSIDEAAKKAGIHPFVLRKTSSLTSSISSKDLEMIIEQTTVCDNRMKSTGVDAWILLEQCLGSIANR